MKFKRTIALTALASFFVTIQVSGSALAAKTYKFTVTSSSQRLTSDLTNSLYIQNIETSPPIKGASCYLAYEVSRYNNAIKKNVVFLQGASNAGTTNSKGKVAIKFRESAVLPGASFVYAVCTYKNYQTSDDPDMPPGQIQMISDY